MKNFELKDTVLKIIYELNKEFDKSGNGIVIINTKEILRRLKQKFPNTEETIGRIDSIIEYLIKQNFLTKINAMSGGRSMIRLNSKFYDSLEEEAGYFTKEYYKERMNLELLATRLELLTAELSKIEADQSLNNKKSDWIKETISMTANTMQIIQLLLSST